MKSFYVFIVLAFLCVAGNAQPRAFFVDDRGVFEKASEALRTIDFESVAPSKGFGKYPPAVGLKAGGVGFRTYGGARFGSGTIYVPSAHYIALNPGLKMLDGAHLSWGAPNQPGNAHLELTFPAGVNAVGADIWASQPVVSPIEITVTTRDGRTHSSTITTKPRPDSTFAGFISESEIASVQFTLAKGQSSLLLDDLAFGRKPDGADLAELAREPSQDPTKIENEKPIASSLPRRSEAAPTAKSEIDKDAAKPSVETSPAAGAILLTQAVGSIAYVRDGKEIRTISPDGSNDRRLWTHADAHERLGIYELAWSPDGSELTFSSGHESVASFYHSDIFSIKPNGTGLRKITNGPDRRDYPKYGKGTVTVTVRNDQPIYRASKASAGVFFVYVVGADLPQPLTLPPGSSRTLTFKNVADFGDHAQAIVAIYGATRWFIPGTDVKAGRVVKAPDFGISGDGIELFGAFRPVWKRDGSRISYRSGVCVVSSISLRGTVGHTFEPMFKGENPPAPCAWDWGPTADTAEQLLYSVSAEDEIIFYRLHGSGGRQPGEKLASFSKEKYQFINDLRWLPDGSGFLFSAAEFARGAANILKYDLATRKAVAVTDFEDTFVKAFSISPDGKLIVFERTKAFIDDDADLWIIAIDGKGLRLLARDANHPAWGK